MLADLLVCQEAYTEGEVAQVFQRSFGHLGKAIWIGGHPPYDTYGSLAERMVRVGAPREKLETLSVAVPGVSVLPVGLLEHVMARESEVLYAYALEYVLRQLAIHDGSDAHIFVHVLHNVLESGEKVGFVTQESEPSVDAWKIVEASSQEIPECFILPGGKQLIFLSKDLGELCIAMHTFWKEPEYDPGLEETLCLRKI